MLFSPSHTKKCCNAIWKLPLVSEFFYIETKPGDALGFRSTASSFCTLGRYVLTRDLISFLPRFLRRESAPSAFSLLAVMLRSASKAAGLIASGSHCSSALRNPFDSICG